MIRALFFIFLTVFPYQVRSEVIPMTEGRLAEFRNLPSSERLGYLKKFYEENKEKNATDQEVFDEIVKIPEIQDNELFIKIASYAKNLGNLDSYLNVAAEKVNQAILKSHPDRKDLLVDPKNIETWKNVRHIIVFKKSLQDYIDTWFNNNSFSETVSDEEAAMFMSTCGMAWKKESALSGVVVFPNDGWDILYTKEGQTPEPPTFDFSKSTGVTIGKIQMPPATKIKDGFGYNRQTTFVFDIVPTTPDRSGKLVATVSATMCRNGECHRKTFPEMTVDVLNRIMATSYCTALDVQRYYGDLTTRDHLQDLTATFQRKEDGRVELTVKMKTGYLINSKKPQLFLYNESGLTFEKTSEFFEDNNYIYRFAANNVPKTGSLSVPLKIVAAFGDKAEGAEIIATEETGVGLRKRDLLTKFSGALATLFYLLTCSPIAALGILLFSLLFRYGDENAVDRIEDFFNGVSRAFLPAGVFFAAIVALFAFVPSLYWGIQFDFPLLNGLWILLFSGASVLFFKETGREELAFWSNWPFKRPSFASESEKAGFFCFWIVVFLLALTPNMTILRVIAENWRCAPVIYTLIVPTGLIISFCALFFIGNRFKKSRNDNSGKLRYLIPLSFGVHIVILLITIVCEAGLLRTAVFALSGAAVSAFFILRKKPLPDFRRISVVLLVLLLTLPPMPRKAVLPPDILQYDEQTAQSIADAGKGVVVSVTSPSCLICRLNLKLLIAGNKEKSYQIMTASGLSKTVRTLARETEESALPMNFAYAPENKKVSLLSILLTPPKVRDLKETFFAPNGAEEEVAIPPEEQIPPTENPPAVEDQR